MSNIELTEENIKKFSKRLHKSLKEKEVEISLSEAKELFSKSLGFNNYYSLSNSIEKIKNVENTTNEQEKNLTIQKELSYSKDITLKIQRMYKSRIEKENMNSKEKAKFFYDKLMLSLNAIDSSIKKCTLLKQKTNNEYADHYFIILKTIFNDTVSISMAEKFSTKDIFNYLIENGIKREDAGNFVRSFPLLDDFFGDEIIGKFEMRELSEELFNLIKEEKNIIEEGSTQSIILKEI